MRDAITISGLRVATRIGVPDEERAQWQTLAIHLTMVPENSLTGLDDDLAGTINYYEVSQWLRALAADKPRKLLETLGEEILTGLLKDFPVASGSVEIRKFILTDTDYVSVSLTRKKGDLSLDR